MYVSFFIIICLQERRKINMKCEKTTAEKTYEKAVAEVVYFDNSDVITTSGGTSCLTWSNKTGNACYFGLTS